MNTALSVAGSDSCAGAGIQADLKTFHAHGVYGLTAITAVTVQNTQKVSAVQEMDPEIVRDQMLCLFEDIEIQAVKVGMVFNVSIIEAIARAFEAVKPSRVVIDPVMISKSGYALLQEEAQEALIKRLLPLAHVLTPNLMEAGTILGRDIQGVKAMKEAARAICDLGPASVVLKGGHLDRDKATDVFYDGQEVFELPGTFTQTTSTHGTGCTFSSAIAANLALGRSLPEAVHQAKAYISEAIAQGLSIGQGHGPTHHFYAMKMVEG